MSGRVGFSLKHTFRFWLVSVRIGSASPHITRFSVRFEWDRFGRTLLGFGLVRMGSVWQHITRCHFVATVRIGWALGRILLRATSAWMGSTLPHITRFRFGLAAHYFFFYRIGSAAHYYRGRFRFGSVGSDWLHIIWFRVGSPYRPPSCSPQSRNSCTFSLNKKYY